jgi:hypothetical protein
MLVVRQGYVDGVDGTAAEEFVVTGIGSGLGDLILLAEFARFRRVVCHKSH